MFRWIKVLLAAKFRRLVLREIDAAMSGYTKNEGARFDRHIAENATALAHVLKNTQTTWGDKARIRVHPKAILNNATLNANSGDIDIGANTIFGHNVSIITGSHPIDEVGEARQSFLTTGRDISIGEGVWIATNAIVLGPCKIGDNAVIAAGAVVVSAEVPAGSVFAGVPARFLRMANSGLSDRKFAQG